MEFFIKKIFNEAPDKLVHLQFSKFSRGNFRDKAVLTAKAQAKGVYKISTTAEYGNELVRFFAEKLGNEESKVSGVIVSTRDLTGELDFQNKKQFMGVKQYVIDREMKGSEILELCEKLPHAFFGLSFKVNGSELKVKAKAPKSAKPSSKGDGEVKVDFCKIKTDDLELVEGLIFDLEAKKFKELSVNHEFQIKEIVISEELKAEAKGDYKIIKDKAKRKGKIIRKVVVDGEEIVKEKEFEV